MVTPATSGSGDEGASLYAGVVTSHKLTATNRLPEGQRTEALQQVVAEKLSTSETANLVEKVRGGQPVAEAAAAVVNERENRKNVAYRRKKEMQESHATRARARQC